MMNLPTVLEIVDALLLLDQSPCALKSVVKGPCQMHRHLFAQKQYHSLHTLVQGICMEPRPACYYLN